MYMPKAKHYLLNIRNGLIHTLSAHGLSDADIGVIMNLHGSTIGRVLEDGNLPIINITPNMAVKKTVAKTSKVAAPKKKVAKKVATTKKVASKRSK